MGQGFRNVSQLGWRRVRGAFPGFREAFRGTLADFTGPILRSRLRSDQAVSSA
jgi:hypothetical protein